MYAALTCLVIGNGFFKPNVSTMVGNLYPEGSHLKDRAYNIFYMGINVGAFLAPDRDGDRARTFGFHPAFAVAAFGMVISVSILWKFKRHIEAADLQRGREQEQRLRTHSAAAVDAPPAQCQPPGCAQRSSRQDTMDAVPEWKRISALIVIFLIVIVFWMVFHQNGSTLTYWADENTDWNVTGTISNAINPFWVVILTFPLVWFWGWLDRKGKEPSTPTKMAIGMMLTGAAFFVLFFAAKVGEATVTGANPYDFRSRRYGCSRLRRADGGRIDALADGAFTRLQGGAGALARRDDGRLVRGHGHRQQADSDRRALGRVAALDFLVALERVGAVHGRRAVIAAAATEESDAGRIALLRCVASGNF